MACKYKHGRECRKGLASLLCGDMDYCPEYQLRRYPKRKPAPDYKGALEMACHEVRYVLCTLINCPADTKCYADGISKCDKAIMDYFIEKAGGRK